MFPDVEKASTNSITSKIFMMSILNMIKINFYRVCQKQTTSGVTKYILIACINAELVHTRHVKKLYT